ncbi:MAG: RluA family pseudouridine synthase [Pseudomonadota bacterium]
MDTLETLFDGPCPLSGRLDKAVSAAVPDLSRVRAQKLIAEGHVILDGKRVTTQTHKAAQGQTLHISAAPTKAWYLKPEPMALDIVFEDAHLLVLNKPAGLVVHPGAGVRSGTLVNGLLAHCGESLTGIGGVERPGIVHRIDKDTSGLLVVAKSQKAYDGLVVQFADHSIERVYQAVVFGCPMPLVGSIDKPIGRHPQHRTIMTIRQETRGGKHAVTHYKVRAAHPNAQDAVASVVECQLETGRTHQIRVHLTALGHPLVGDKTYSKGRQSRFSPINSFPRHALHAAKLGFIHPDTGKLLTFEAEYPADIGGLVSAMETMHS